MEGNESTINTMNAMKAICNPDQESRSSDKQETVAIILFIDSVQRKDYQQLGNKKSSRRPNVTTR
jgi:hypothetical protein